MVRIPLAREGWPFIFAGVGLSLGGALLQGCIAAGLALALTLFVTWFFRDPERATPTAAPDIVSPADGRVILVSPQADGGTMVSIFLSIFNVHVNRVPVSGAVQEVNYRPGGFLPAWHDKASTANERAEVVLAHPRGLVRCTQIAGLIARRIVCRLAPGQQVRRGDRYGLIRFGSRVDIFFPPAVAVAVKVGDRVRGGSDTIAHWRD